MTLGHPPSYPPSRGGYRTPSERSQSERHDVDIPLTSRCRSTSSSSRVTFASSSPMPVRGSKYCAAQRVPGARVPLDLAYIPLLKARSEPARSRVKARVCGNSSLDRIEHGCRKLVLDERRIPRWPPKPPRNYLNSLGRCSTAIGISRWRLTTAVPAGCSADKRSGRRDFWRVRGHRGVSPQGDHGIRTDDSRAIVIAKNPRLRLRIARTAPPMEVQ